MGGLLLMGLLVLLVIVAVAVVAAQKARQPATSVQAPTFEARKELFSPAERSFFGVLEQAVAGELKVFGKVRLGDLIQPAKGLSRSQRARSWNRINQKHIDFVLCQPDTLAVAGVVELDDASHRRKDRVERDSFVDKALESAGVQVLNFPARKGYAVSEIRAKLAEGLVLKIQECDPPNPWTEMMEKVESDGQGSPSEMLREDKKSAIVAPADNPAQATVSKTTPICPACNSPMVKRRSKKGQYAGQWFWACSGYPKCRKIVTVGS